MLQQRSEISSPDTDMRAWSHSQLPYLATTLPWLAGVYVISLIPAMHLLTVGLGMLLLGVPMCVAGICTSALRRHRRLSALFRRQGRLYALLSGRWLEDPSLDVRGGCDVVRPVGPGSRLRTCGMGGLGRHGPGLCRHRDRDQAPAAEGRDARRRGRDRSTGLLAPYLSGGGAGPPCGCAAVVDGLSAICVGRSRNCRANPRCR